MNSLFIDAINAHRTAWQAFQDAPSDDDHEDTRRAADRECQALHDLVQSVPQDQHDLQALRDHLEWWVTEEAQRRQNEPAPFAMYAIIRLAEERERQRLTPKARALMQCVDFDNNGAMVAGELRGGDGGLISRDTIKAADELRKALAVTP